MNDSVFFNLISDLSIINRCINAGNVSYSIGMEVELNNLKASLKELETVSKDPEHSIFKVDDIKSTISSLKNTISKLEDIKAA